MRLSSIVFHVIPNGPPNAPEPPLTSMPPLIVTKCSCTFAAPAAWTPLEIVPLSPGASSLPTTNVAPDPMTSPLQIVTGPVLKHVAAAGTCRRQEIIDVHERTRLAPAALGRNVHHGRRHGD